MDKPVDFETAMKRYQTYSDSHVIMTMEETEAWLEQMRREAPTQEDLGKDVIYQND